jgi:hypothetical protein
MEEEPPQLSRARIVGDSVARIGWNRRNRRGPQDPRELERRVERDRVRRGTHLDPKDSALREAGEDRGSWELVSVAAQASSQAQEETEQRASEGADGHGRLAASS